MSRPEGLPKTGGRIKGTPNKRSLKLNEIFESLDYHVPSAIIEILPKLEPPDQMRTLLKLMEFIYPKRSTIGMSVREILEGEGKSL